MNSLFFVLSNIFLSNVCSPVESIIQVVCFNSGSFFSWFITFLFLLYTSIECFTGFCFVLLKGTKR